MPPQQGQYPGGGPPGQGGPHGGGPPGPIGSVIAPHGTNPNASPTTDSAGGSYFAESRKGEVNELRQLLKNFTIEKSQKRKRDVIKKVIMYMTLGIDVSRLFTEMMLAIETRDLVIKKMVYLFIGGYASGNPDLAQMCINSLQKDASSEDPTVRGLALRTLLSLRVPQLVEYVADPLKKSLTDGHGYVRKTGVIGLLKLYHLDRAAFDEGNYVDVLYDMLRDTDPQVVANCVVVLEEIMAPEGGMALNRPIVLHLLNRLHEFPEFGMTAILGLLPRYKPEDEDETFQIMNLLDPILRSSSPAAMLGTVRVFLHLTGGNTEMQMRVMERVRAPLLTHVASAPPECAHALLSHMELLVRLCPGVFDPEYRQMYVRYNEPTHIKYLKVNLLALLAGAETAQDICSELSEYVSDVDVRLSRLAVRAMGRIACRLHPGSSAGAEGAAIAEGIVCRLVEFLELAALVPHVAAEGACRLADVLRRHPALRGHVAPALPKALRHVADPHGKAAVIWMLGESGDILVEAPYALEKLIDGYPSIGRMRGQSVIKAALLTATMKLFFKRPPEVREMLGRLLTHAVEDVSSQDLHDRALTYYRLLRAGPEHAEVVISGRSAEVSGDGGFLEEDLKRGTRDLMREFNTLAVVYGRPSDSFVAEKYRSKAVDVEWGEGEGMARPPEAPAAVPTTAGETAAPPTGEMDLMSIGGQPAEPQTFVAPVAPAPAPAPAAPSDFTGDLLGDLLDFGAPPPASVSVAPVAPVAPALRLATGPNITGSEYQALWSSEPSPAAEGKMPLAALPADTLHIERSLLAFDVGTMASGDLPNEIKVFCYGKDADTGKFLLAQVVVDKNLMEMSVVIKSDIVEGKAEKAGALLEIVQRAIMG